MIGIYKITNKINGKSYIGQSINIEQRWKEHKYKDRPSLIHQAIVKYGVDNFNFEILEECEQNLLNKKEKYYISFFNTIAPNGYNVEDGGTKDKHIDDIKYKKLSEEIFQQIVYYLQNTNLTQLEIANKFNISKDYLTDINLGISLYHNNISYPIRKKIKQYCIKCGKEISKNGVHNLCRECYNQSTRTVERPNKFVLANEIINTNFCAVGRKYGVTDNAIRKWCKAYGLPTKKDELKKWLEQNKEI